MNVIGDQFLPSGKEKRSPPIESGKPSSLSALLSQQLHTSQTWRVMDNGLFLLKINILIGQMASWQTKAHCFVHMNAWAMPSTQ